MGPLLRTTWIAVAAVAAPSCGRGETPGTSGGAGVRARTPAAPGEVATAVVDAGTSHPLTFAVIGDYGVGPASAPADVTGAEAVARSVHDFQPDFVVTTGDNNYSDVAGGTIDDHVGHLYSAFLGNYRGAYGPGSRTNRFWPALGNHDYVSGIDEYLRYFTLPGTERYYDVDLGRVHLFAIDSDPEEPDGVTSDSRQAAWLERALAASRSCFDVVYFHHPPYTSGNTHGASTYMRWPFQSWGADVVLSGHEHIYERLDVDGLPYFISGTGGASRYGIGPPIPESKARYTGNFGALYVTVRADAMEFEYVTVDGVRRDSLVLAKRCAPGGE